MAKMRKSMLTAVAEPVSKRRCHGQGASETSFHRRVAEFGDLKIDQVRQLKDLERENACVMSQAGP
jgi:uncharacterized OsmC-like protein